MTPKAKQPWLHSALVDLLFILSPPFLCLLALKTFPAFFREDATMPLAAWVVLVLLIDVSHVYSTLFRTYFDRETFANQKQLLLTVPLLAWSAGMMLYALDALLFWRLLAYLAVFHFIRQQYGFLQLYTRQESLGKKERQLNTLAVYTATLYPILFWHLEGKRDFNWLIAGDFVLFPLPGLLPFLTAAYWLVLGLYLAKEIRAVYQKKKLNLPANLVVAGTALSWYLGIVHYNGDLIYTTFNVVSHGIPYLALVWIYGRRKHRKARHQQATLSQVENLAFGKAGLALFLGVVALLAYMEEGLWDSMVWREHAMVFPLFGSLPQVQDSLLLNILVPLLALPQLTHYVLDGFIWKVSANEHLKA